MSKHPPTCAGCPFDAKGGVFVPPDTPHKETKLVVFGEAPGEDEALYRRGFIGASGRLLRRALKLAGLRPGYQRRDDGRWTDDEVAYRNVILCHPPGNRFPGDDIARECLHRHQQKFVEGDKHPWLLAGARSVAALTDSPPTNINQLRGSVLPRVDPSTREWLPNRWAVATLHPAYLLHKAAGTDGSSQEHLLPYLFMDASKAVEHCWPSIPEVTILNSPTQLYAEWNKRSTAARNTNILSLDIEGRPGFPPAIVGVGWQDNQAFVLDGWSDSLKHVLTRMMAQTIPLLHNASYDLPELTDVGVPYPSESLDTINTAALMDPSLKKGLEPQVTSHVAGSLTWKQLVSHKHSIDAQPPEAHACRTFWAKLLHTFGRSAPQTNRQWYGFYNGLDVAWTWALYFAHRKALGPRVAYYDDLLHPLEAPLAAQGRRGMLADPKRMAYHHQACSRLEARAAKVLQAAGEKQLEVKLRRIALEVTIMEDERDAEREAAGKRGKFSRAKEMAKLKGKLRTAENNFIKGFNGNSSKQRIDLLYDWYGLPTIQGQRSSKEDAINELLSRIDRNRIVAVDNATLPKVKRVLECMKAASKWSTWRANFLELGES